MMLGQCILLKYSIFGKLTKKNKIEKLKSKKNNWTMITRRSSACRMSLFLYYSIHARMKTNKTENATSNENYYRSWILFCSCVNDRICLVLRRIFYFRSFAILSHYYFPMSRSFNSQNIFLRSSKSIIFFFFVFYSQNNNLVRAYLLKISSFNRHRI